MISAPAFCLKEIENLFFIIVCDTCHMWSLLPKIKPHCFFSMEKRRGIKNIKGVAVASYKFTS